MPIAGVAAKVRVESAGRSSLDATLRADSNDLGVSDKWSEKHLHNCFDWIIATVPDPEFPEMKLDFDREVETIQNAAESSDQQSADSCRSENQAE